MNRHDMTMDDQNDNGQHGDGSTMSHNDNKQRCPAQWQHGLTQDDKQQDDNVVTTTQGDTRQWNGRQRVHWLTCFQYIYILAHPFLSLYVVWVPRLFSNVVYNFVPMVPKAPTLATSSKKDFLHWAIPVRFDNRILSKVLNMIKYILSEVAEVVSRTNRAVGHKGSP